MCRGQSEEVYRILKHIKAHHGHPSYLIETLSCSAQATYVASSAMMLYRAGSPDLTRCSTLPKTSCPVKEISPRCVVAGRGCHQYHGHPSEPNLGAVKTSWPVVVSVAIHNEAVVGVAVSSVCAVLKAQQQQNMPSLILGEQLRVHGGRILSIALL